jgi:hypothetical protein
MSDTPYFDAYEARRRRTTIGTATRFVTPSSNSRITVERLGFDAYAVPYTSSQSGALRLEYPTYRVVKQYNTHGVLIDFTIEMRENSNSEWQSICKA